MPGSTSGLTGVLAAISQGQPRLVATVTQAIVNTRLSNTGVTYNYPTPPRWDRDPVDQRALTAFAELRGFPQSGAALWVRLVRGGRRAVSTGLNSYRRTAPLLRSNSQIESLTGVDLARSTITNLFAFEEHVIISPEGSNIVDEQQTLIQMVVDDSGSRDDQYSEWLEDEDPIDIPTDKTQDMQLFEHAEEIRDSGTSSIGSGLWLATTDRYDGLKAGTITFSSVLLLAITGRLHSDE